MTLAIAFIPIMLERLQKIISRYGIASRRGSEHLIQTQQVRVNGVIVTELGTKADPNCDRIEINGKLLQPHHSPQLIYLLLHKPIGVICSRHDPQGRKTIQDLLPPHYHHLYSVGRLDYNSSGALLLTNDGELANQLTHPRHHVSKTYAVWVRGCPSAQALQQWRQGVDLDGKLTLPAAIEILDKKSDRTQLRVILKEGRNRQIRRVSEMLGHPVLVLHRVAIANIQLGKLELCQHRQLSDQEIQQLKAWENI